MDVNIAPQPKFVPNNLNFLSKILFKKPSKKPRYIISSFNPGIINKKSNVLISKGPFLLKIPIVEAIIKMTRIEMREN